MRSHFENSTTALWTTLLKASTAIGVVLVAWELVGRAGWIHISLFPPPSKVATALVEMTRSGELLKDIWVSTRRAFLGFLLGGSTAIAVGIVAGRVSWMDQYISPIIQLLRPLPPVAIIPLIIVWLGIGETSKLFSIAFAVFFPVWISSYLGAHEVPRTFIWSARSLNVAEWRILYNVVLPSALPFIVAGCRTGIAVAFIMVFVSELAGASSGLGYQISVSHLAYRIDRMMAALAVLGVCGAASDALVLRGSRWLFPWLTLSTNK
jgi:ABC-type nitrate/sulfonate/bicarbonate transport system permease component